jgi:thiol:disulfide interchange protein
MPMIRLSRQPNVSFQRTPAIGAGAIFALTAGVALLCSAGGGISGLATPAVAQIIGPAPAATSKHIYSETADPKADIEAAMAQARREHKRVILDFGGDWCGDCQVLDIYFHKAPNSDLLAKKFVLVHVWIGHMDKNIDVAAKYGVPINKGVPALAVLAPDGKVLYSQATGEFADMRHMDPASVSEFLNKWKD